jgi:nicotinamide mononucleotide adenylyltransferase
MKVAARICNKVVIGIGSANVIDKDNPFTVNERERWLKQQLDRFGLTPHVSKIVRLDDFYDNERWGNETLEVAGHIDAVIGNNDWVNGIFKDKNGIAIVETPLFARDFYQGSEIRPKLRELRLLRS